MESHTLNPPLQNSASPRQREPDASDLERLRKWQEERIARKLRGEYESAIIHLSELVSRLHLYKSTTKADMMVPDQ
jgi:outer membrane protein insertion porin family